MRLLGCIFAAVLGALAQAGAPIFTHAGPLACGMRLYQPGLVQEYCYYNLPPAPLKTVCNALHAITPLNPGDSLPVAASQSCFATDAAGGNIYAVTWLVWQPIVALPSGSTGTIAYQIASSTVPCTVNQSGACVSAAGALAATTMQQGSFSSGVLVAGLTTFEADGQPPIIIDDKPQAQWRFAAAPGLAVISTSGLAHAITPTGLCAVASGEQGVATFARTNGQLRVGWLRNGWCPNGPGSAQPELQGACSPLAMSMTATVDPYLAIDAGLRCTAAPLEPAQAIVNAIMFWADLAAVIQGQ